MNSYKTHTRSHFHSDHYAWCQMVHIKAYHLPSKKNPSVVWPLFWGFSLLQVSIHNLLSCIHATKADGFHYPYHPWGTAKNPVQDKNKMEKHARIQGVSTCFLLLHTHSFGRCLEVRIKLINTFFRLNCRVPPHEGTMQRYNFSTKLTNK